MFGLGLPEMIIISVVGVALFGSKRIPELGKAVAQTIRSFKQEIKGEPEPEILSKTSQPDDKN